MEPEHPLGREFSDWAELTDEYRSRLEQASTDDIPQRSQLERMVRRLRVLASAATASVARRTPPPR